MKFQRLCLTPVLKIWVKKAQNIEACGYIKHICVSLPVTQRFEFRTFRIGAPNVQWTFPVYFSSNTCGCTKAKKFIGISKFSNSVLSFKKINESDITYDWIKNHL